MSESSVTPEDRVVRVARIVAAVMVAGVLGLAALVTALDLGGSGLSVLVVPAALEFSMMDAIFSSDST